MLQQEVRAQDDLTSHLNISMPSPMSPTSRRGAVPSAQEQELHLAKSQLGFIDSIAEPLWNIGATLFFRGMTHGLEQIRENRQVWMSKIVAIETSKESKIEKDSSVSTVTSGETTVGQSDVTVPTPLTPSATATNELRKVSSNMDLNGDDVRRRRVRKERSFPTLIFWRRKAGRKVQQREQV